MDLKRCSGVWIALAMLIIGRTATVFGQNLICTNDFENFLSCDFEAQNCAEYNLTLESEDWDGQKDCILKHCKIEQCCCSFKLDSFFGGDIHTATVWNKGRSIESKNISITDSIKPKTPTIISVSESNANFQVVWLTNMKEILSKSLTAKVTYHIKGEKSKVMPECFNQTRDNGKNDCEIVGADLKPGTTYVVSVKSFTHLSGKFSDSSNEWEFTTPKSSTTLFLVIVSGLSVFAVFISGAIYICYVKYKTKWWDSVDKCPNPKLLNMHPSEQEVLKPMPPILSSICVEPLPDDGKMWSKHSMKDSISTGSSCLSYANMEPVDIRAGVQDALGKALANICPTPLTTNLLTEFNKDSGLLCAPQDLCDVSSEDMSLGSPGFLNKTYSILIPRSTHQISTDSSEVQTDMPCESAYHPSEGVTVASSYQQAPACPLVTLPPGEVSSLLPTDMSYQPYNADSGRFSYAEDSGSSSIASVTTATASCDPVPRLDEVDGDATKLNENIEQATVWDENPGYGSVPADKQSFPPVDYDYQPFQNLVEQPFIKMPSSLLNPIVPCPMNDIQGGQCPSELQRPFHSLVSAGQSMPTITDSGYHCY